MTDRTSNSDEQTLDDEQTMDRGAANPVSAERPARRASRRASAPAAAPATTDTLGVEVPETTAGTAGVGESGTVAAATSTSRRRAQRQRATSAGDVSSLDVAAEIGLGRTADELAEQNAQQQAARGTATRGATDDAASPEASSAAQQPTRTTGAVRRTRARRAAEQDAGDTRTADLDVFAEFGVGETDGDPAVEVPAVGDSGTEDSGAEPEKQAERSARRARASNRARTSDGADRPARRAPQRTGGDPDERDPDERVPDEVEQKERAQDEGRDTGDDAPQETRLPAAALLFQAPEPRRRARRATDASAGTQGDDAGDDADKAGDQDDENGQDDQRSTRAQAADEGPRSSGRRSSRSGVTGAAQDRSGDDDDQGDENEPDDERDENDEERSNQRRRRRRGGRGRRRRTGEEQPDDSDEDSGDGNEDTGDEDNTAEDNGDDEADTSDDSRGSDDDGDEERSSGQSRRRSRRRRGGRGRTSEDVEDSSDSEEDVDDNGDDEDGSEGSSRRRRRRRRSSTADDGAARARSEVTALKGSTRLEAKRQRRREGREAGRRRPLITEAEFLARRESVERRMIVREQDGLNQIAVLEDGMLVEHYVARHTQTSLVGNVYLGRVQNVLPSMEAAFIDIGKGRNAVLYAGEVNWDAAGMSGQPRRIEKALKSGDAVLAQVTKDPIGHKGARLTSQVTLAGRYLVLVPSGAMTGISRKLPENERARLKKLLKTIVPDSMGVIVRTAAEGASEQQLRDDVERLTRRWEDISAKSKNTKSAPALLKGEPELAVRVVRDVFNEDFSSLEVQGDEAWQTISGYVTELSPDLTDRMHHWTKNTDIFTSHRIDEQLAKGMDRKVWLPSGGSLVIDRTEAMTVVDVNTGKFTGAGSTLEETVTKNNLEAAEEIVRQLRLRDIGGIIVIDFIDMVLEANRDLVLRRLIECLGRDRTRHQVAEVTSLGLVQMTRKRVGQGLVEAFSTTCERCEGRGFVVHDHPVEDGPDRDGAQDAGRRNSRRSGGRPQRPTDQQAPETTSQEDEAEKAARQAVKATLATIAAAAASAHETGAATDAAAATSDAPGWPQPTGTRTGTDEAGAADETAAEHGSDAPAVSEAVTEAVVQEATAEVLAAVEKAVAEVATTQDGGTPAEQDPTDEPSRDEPAASRTSGGRARSGRARTSGRAGRGRVASQADDGGESDSEPEAPRTQPDAVGGPATGEAAVEHSATADVPAEAPTATTSGGSGLADSGFADSGSGGSAPGDSGSDPSESAGSASDERPGSARSTTSRPSRRAGRRRATSGGAVTPPAQEAPAAAPVTRTAAEAAAESGEKAVEVPAAEVRAAEAPARRRPRRATRAIGTLDEPTRTLEEPTGTLEPAGEDAPEG